MKQVLQNLKTGCRRFRIVDFEFMAEVGDGKFSGCSRAVVS